MTFEELYQQEKEKAGGERPVAFLQRIAVATVSSVDAVYQWALGWRNPNGSAAELASRELGIPAEELFPNSRTSKVRKSLGAAMLIAGLVLAVCTMDGSAYEIPVRFAGVGLVAAGGFVGNLFKKGGER